MQGNKIVVPRDFYGAAGPLGIKRTRRSAPNENKNQKEKRGEEGNWEKGLSQKKEEKSSDKTPTFKEALITHQWAMWCRTGRGRGRRWCVPRKKSRGLEEKNAVVQA